MAATSRFAQRRVLLQEARISFPELVRSQLEAISASSHLNAFLEVFSEQSVAEAERIQQSILEGSAGRLAGMVIGIKDVFALQNQSVTCGSRILSGFQSQFTATCLQRLLDEDALFIGRQNCDEFAMGSSNENSAFGPVRNAANPEHVPGGSSGGSAVAVQAGLCDASIATDTGGSIRQPAAFCGVVGLKGTYSRVSRSGLVAYGSSFDCIGPLTTSVSDAALIYEIMAGADPMDSTSSRKPVERYSQLTRPGRKKVAVWKEVMQSPSIQPEIREACERTIRIMEEAGHEIVYADLPYLDYLLPVYYILTTSEASSNLSRYDGMQFGYRSPNGQRLEEVIKNTRTEGFGTEVTRRILLGTFALSAEYHDAYFTKAQQVRRLIYDSAVQLFSDVDFLLMPTTPTTAFKLGAKTQDPMEMYLADIFTVWSNLAGVPAISLPVGHDSAGLPIGLQFHAGHFQEKSLLDFGAFLEAEIAFPSPFVSFK